MSIIQSRRRADLAAVAVSGLAAAWTAYTPTVVSGTGTLTSVAATGRYVKVGKIVFVEIDILITTNGTGATYVDATLPFTAANNYYILAGRERTITGKMLQGQINNNAHVPIFAYDNSYPGGDGRDLVVSGIYEAA